MAHHTVDGSFTEEDLDRLLMGIRAEKQPSEIIPEWGRLRSDRRFDCALQILRSRNAIRYDRMSRRWVASDVLE